jgi:hypothetical protein
MKGAVEQGGVTGVCHAVTVHNAQHSRPAC